MIWWIIAAIIVIVILGFVMSYNRIIRLRNQAENSWSQIDVQLQKRANLVPELVNTVKGYAAHEKEVLEEVTRARAAMANAGGVQETQEATNMLQGALKSLFAVSENYPELKANTNFQKLQEQLESIENNIAYTRQAYNDAVKMYNQQIQQMPGNMMARQFGFEEKEYFHIDDPSTAKPPTVEF